MVGRRGYSAVNGNQNVLTDPFIANTVYIVESLRTPPFGESGQAEGQSPIDRRLRESRRNRETLMRSGDHHVRSPSDQHAGCY
jgi:hypothetical protein